MDRYHMLADPFSAMDEGELVLVISFILSTAYNTYRDWVSFGKPCTPQAAASLVGELTCNGIGKLAKTV